MSEVGAYLDWPRNNPPPYDADEMVRAKARLWELVQEVSLIQLAYVDGLGEPLSQPLRFEAEHDGDCPVLFVDAATAGLLELLKTQGRAKVSVSMFRAVGFENRHDLRSAQIQATTVLEQLARDRGALPAGSIAARIEPVQSAWHDAVLRPPQGTILFGVCR